MDEIEEHEESQVFQQVLHNFQLFLQSLQEHASNEAETQPTVPSEIEGLKEHLQLQQAQAEVRWALEEKIEALGTQLSSTAIVRERATPAPLTAPEVTLRKDFQIWGQIVEGGQKEKLSFTSLTNQIESGLKKGYSKTEKN